MICRDGIAGFALCFVSVDAGQRRIDEFVVARLRRILLQVRKNLEHCDFAVIQVLGVLVVETVLKEPINGLPVGVGERGDPLIPVFYKTRLGGIMTDVSCFRANVAVIFHGAGFRNAACRFRRHGVPTEFDHFCGSRVR